MEGWQILATFGVIIIITFAAFSISSEDQENIDLSTYITAAEAAATYCTPSTCNSTIISNQTFDQDLNTFDDVAFKNLDLIYYTEECAGIIDSCEEYYNKTITQVGYKSPYCTGIFNCSIVPNAEICDTVDFCNWNMTDNKCHDNYNYESREIGCSYVNIEHCNFIPSCDLDESGICATNDGCNWNGSICQGTGTLLCSEEEVILLDGCEKGINSCSLQNTEPNTYLTTLDATVEISTSLILSDLSSCSDTLETDGNGLIICGTDETGASAFDQGGIYNTPVDNYTIRFYSSENDLYNEGNPLEFISQKNSSKSYLTWINNESGSMQEVGWIGCHNMSETDLANNPHSHCSWETWDTTTDTLNTRFEIGYGKSASQLIAQFSNLMTVKFNTDVNLTGILKMTGTSADIRHSDELDIYPSGNTSVGFRMALTSGLPYLSGLGSSWVVINDNTKVIGAVNTTDRYNLPYTAYITSNSTCPVVIMYNSTNVAQSYCDDYKTEDLRFSANALKITGSFNVPDYTTFLGNTEVLAFDSGTMEQAFISMQMPHERKAGTLLYPHFHLSNGATTENNNAVFCLEYTCANINAAFPATTTACTVQAFNTTANVHKMTAADIIITNDLGSSSMCNMRIFRNATDSRDTFTQDIYLLEFDVHYLINDLQ